MKKQFDPRTFFSPARIFVLYLLVCALGIMGFRLVFPGEAPPIPWFSRSWRLVQGLLTLIGLFPALAMSALVIPFGRAALDGEEYSSFSPKFFQIIRGPVITAISAVVIYGLLFFLALPIVQDREANMRAEGALYRLARDRARSHSQAGEWPEAAQFIAICERIWPESPEMERLKNQAAIHMEERRFDEDEERAEAAAGFRSAGLSALPGQRQPVDAAQALTLAEAALGEERYFDAHWLSTLAERISRPGSPEALAAVRLAGRAWNAVQSLAPNARETRLFRIFRLKQSGYEAMISGDWIRAFYLFQELLELTPNDPDAATFFAKSEQGAKEIAFFHDEIELAVGETLTGAVFSLPGSGGRPGRAVLRFSGLSGFADYSYGLGLEYISFDGDARPVSRMEAPYAKILPIRIDDRPRTLILLRALDRQDRNRRWEPSWAADPALPPAPGAEIPGDARLLLDMGYEDFLLLSHVRRGLDNLYMRELFTARTLGSSGYLPQVFEAEIIYRLSVPLFFLPLAILAIILGWRFRAKKRPRYLFIPMLPILPLVFNGLVYLYRAILNTAGIWVVISLGFSAALVVFIAALVFLFIVFLILLAAQHG
ncbi:MAG: hypothetical protein LBK27_01125 [Treponema sp.]|jgi:hypothetical protein|nr:hypothetical protein [Treponema sp.]